MCMLRLFMRSANSCIFVVMSSMFSCSKCMLLVVVVFVLFAIWLGGGEGGLCGRGELCVIQVLCVVLVVVGVLVGWVDCCCCLQLLGS